MPKQLNSDYNEVAIPFSQMTFTPDVPTANLAANEYNDGLNVETDVRGIRSVAGDVDISYPSLVTIPGIPTYISGGYRHGGTFEEGQEFWYIVATYTINPDHPDDSNFNEGRWYASVNGENWQDITPNNIPIQGYNQSINITEAWNGTVPFFNDGINPPMFLPESTLDNPNPKLIQYSNTTPAGIDNISYYSPTEQIITLSTPYELVPYQPGEQILIDGINSYFNGTFTVTSSTTTQIIYQAVPGASYTSGGVVSPKYSWNYIPYWRSYSAQFMRMYSTPNVGSILVAGNLVAVEKTGDTITGDTVEGSNQILSPSSTSASLVGKSISGPGIPSGTIIMKIFAGIIFLSKTCLETNTGSTFYVDNRVLYPVTVQWSQAFGLNQAPDTWTPTITNVANQLEVPLRGPCVDAFPCNGQFFLCSYWDTVVFSPLNYSTTSAPILGVKLVNQGRGLLTSNAWANTDKLVYGIDARDIWVFDGQDFKGIGNQRVKNWFFDQLSPDFYERIWMETNTQKNQIEIYYPDSEAVDGVPNKMLSYRYDLDVWNSPRNITNATFGCESPILSKESSIDPDIWSWKSNPSSRTVIYVKGEQDSFLTQKDYGYKINNQPINSYFRRDNIKLLNNYSGKLMVHRLLPETVNIGGVPFTGDYNKQLSESTGNVSVKIEGSDSVGQLPLESTTLTMTLNTNNPWLQPNQNSHRVNSITIENTSDTDIWMTTATTWQYTQTEDDR